MMNFDETNIRVNIERSTCKEEDNMICNNAAEQIIVYLKTFGQLPKDKQVFTHPDFDFFYIDIIAIDPIENMIICFVDFSAS